MESVQTSVFYFSGKTQSADERQVSPLEFSIGAVLPGRREGTTHTTAKRVKKSLTPWLGH